MLVFPDAPDYAAGGVAPSKDRRTAALGGPSSHAGERAPESYVTHTLKEKLALEYTERFSAAFTAKAKAKARQDRIHDGPGAPYAHRELFVAPPNEYGLPKLVPTTVRPTLLPHSELYDAPALATFVANRIAYEPLADPLLPPSTLPSPTATLEWGTGDAFDLSSLLAGYLLGAGYDAYVVWGRAPRWVAARELGERPHPALRDSIERAAAEADAAAAASEPPPGDEPGLPSAEEAALAEALGQLGIVLPKYEAKARGIEPSRYEAKLAEIAAAESSANILRGAAADSKTSGTAPDEALPEASSASADPTEDEPRLLGRRAHCWVLVRGGKRNDGPSFFIEPSTGARCAVSRAPYLCIEAAWNAANYWVNENPTARVGDLEYDFQDDLKWSSLFLDPNAADDTADDGGGEAKEAAEPTRVLDVPPPWPLAPTVTRNEVTAQYPPSGYRSTLYRRAKHELFADHPIDAGTGVVLSDPHSGAASDGLVERLTLYGDDARTRTETCQETFSRRADKLVSRTRRHAEGRVTEVFGRGRPGGLRSLEETVAGVRAVRFDGDARPDKLVARDEEVGKKIVERFEGRKDRLAYRSVTFFHPETCPEPPEADRALLRRMPGEGDPPGGVAKDASRHVVRKMTEKYLPPADGPPEAGIAKRTFFCAQGRTVVRYHYATGRVTRRIDALDASKEAVAKAADERRDAHTVGLPPPDSLLAHAAAERACYEALRRNQADVLQEVLAARQDEEAAVAIAPWAYDIARTRVRDSAAAAEAKAAAAAAAAAEAAEGDGERDPLAPFLASCGDPDDPTAEEAHRAREACLKSLKDRLRERANIMQTRLNEAHAGMAKKQAAFQSRGTGDPAAAAEFQEFCVQAMFRIQVLQDRLRDHEATATDRYRALESELEGDERLAVLYG